MMKHIIIFLFCSMFISICYSQELFIKDVVTRSSTEVRKINDYLTTIFCEDYFSGTVDVGVFLEDKVYVTVPDENLTIEYKLRERNDKKWVGDAQNGEGMLIAVINGTKIIASVVFNDELYQICSLDDTLSVFAKLDQSYFAEESSCATPNLSTVSVNSYDASDGIDICPMRVLVTYTPSAARQSYPDIISRTKLAIEETNQSYANSRMGQRAELAACVAVGYQEVQSESGYGTDLDRFAGKSDGYMDEIHRLRDIYSADVCVLIEDIYKSGLAGIARTIYANENTAFCIVDFNSMVGYYSFAHEIGHLQGARHDVNVDDSSSPFSYGHGYISPYRNWRTIMGYGNACNNCRRILYWSNPDVIYPYDNIPMGTVNRENNAKVLKQTSYYVNGFKPTNSQLILPNVNIGNAEYVYWVSTNTIENAGNVEINSGAEVCMRSLNTIKLSPGFYAKEGSKLTIINGAVCSGFYDVNNAKYLNDNSLDNTVGNVDIDYSNGLLKLDKYGPIEQVNIFNLEGIEIKKIIPTSKEIDLSFLPLGNYILKIHTLGNVCIEKIFIK